MAGRLGFANIGVLASTLCAVHCLALPFLAGAAFLEHSAVHSPVFEAALVGVAAVVGYLTLGAGYRHHRRPLPLTLLTMGLILLAGAHAVTASAVATSIAVVGALLLVTAQMVNRSCPAPCCAGH
jgi:hypothetical protein